MSEETSNTGASNLSLEQRQKKYSELVAQLEESIKDLIEVKKKYASGESDKAGNFAAGVLIDSSYVRQICKEILELEVSDALPMHLREYVWQVLLGCYNKDGSVLDDWMQKYRISPSQELIALQETREDNLPNRRDSIGSIDEVKESSGGSSGKINYFSFRNRKVPSSDSDDEGDHIFQKAETSDWLKTLRADMPRTRTDCPIFLGNPKTQADVELVLTFYCVSRGVAYKQGLNELLAPFVALRIMNYENEEEKLGIDPTKLPWGTLYLTFYHFISKFFPSIYDDEEFESLQCIFRLFQLLLQYHDPGLANFLHQNQLIPELYAIPWFITMFARNLRLDLVFPLWDRCIVYDDPFLHYMMALAIMINCRSDLMETDPGSLPSALSSIQKHLKDMEMLRSCIKQALSLRARTPLSFRQDLYEISFKLNKRAHRDRIKKLSEFYRELPCLMVPPQEIVSQSFNQILEDGTLRYLALDCRSLAEYEAGHLPCAIHLDPHWLEKPDLLEEKMAELLNLKGYHVCLIGRGGMIEDSPSKLPFNKEECIVVCIILQFLQKSFSYVSWCRAGYSKCHKLVSEMSNSELIDHDHQLCAVCNNSELSSPTSQTRKSSNSSTTASALVQASKSTFLSGISKFKNSLSYIAIAAQSIDTSVISPAMSPRSTATASANQTPDVSSTQNISRQVFEEKERSSLELHEGKINEDNLPILDISDWQESGEFTFFRCLEVVASADPSKLTTKHRLLAISKGYVLVLDPVRTSDTSQGKHVRLICKDQIRYLSKITSKNPKKADSNSNVSGEGPKIVIFYWQDVGRSDEAQMSESRDSPASNKDLIKRSFLVNDARECIDLVKKYYSIFQT